MAIPFLASRFTCMCSTQMYTQKKGTNFTILRTSGSSSPENKTDFQEYELDAQNLRFLIK